MNFADVPEPPVPAYQSPAEFGCLWDLVASRPHARVLEVGSLYGGTLWWWSHLPWIDTLVSVDLPSEWEPVAAGVREARRHWADWFSPRVTFLDFEADSQAVETAVDVFAALPGGPPVGRPFDFAFIDGDHTYDGVRADWLNWSPLVRSGGLVAFHDTWPNGDRVEPGVVQWCDELRHHLPSIEWTSPDGVGICAFIVP